MGAASGREGRRELRKNQKKLKCENDWNSHGFQNRAQDFITHTWTAEGMEKPLPVCAHVHTHTHSHTRTYVHSTAGLFRGIIRIMFN